MDDLRKGSALIRSTFPGVDPYELSDDEYAELFSEAIWLKHFDRTNHKNAILEALEVAFKKID